MNQTEIRSHQESVHVAAPADVLYALVSDIGRTGEWSPVCTTCWWEDDAQAGQVGAWFTGRNVLAGRTWETRSEVVVADPGREFAWVVGGTYVRWSFSLVPTETGTTLTESWDFLPGGIAMFNKVFGDDADAQILDRTNQALDGIPKTLAELKRIAEGASAAGADIG